MSGNLPSPDTVVVTRNNERRFTRDNALHIASIAGRLRAHARRCRVERGYVTPDGEGRVACAQGIAGLAGRLEQRASLGLSVRWWLARATILLQVLEKTNRGNDHG